MRSQGFGQNGDSDDLLKLVIRARTHSVTRTIRQTSFDEYLKPGFNKHEPNISDMPQSFNIGPY